MSPSCFLPLQEALQVQQVGLTQAPFTLLLLPRGWSVRDFVCVLQEWSLYFPQPTGFPQIKPHWTSMPDVLWAHLPGAGPLGLEA